MNRWDEIQAIARDVASNIHSDPDKVAAMADDLIKLVGLMVGAPPWPHDMWCVGGRTLRPVPAPELAPASCGAVDSDDLDACGVCPDCRRSQLKVVADPESSARSVFGPVRKWGRLPEQPQQGESQPSQHYGFIPGDAVPACDFDPNCPTHGILGKQP